jgi:hypothetical protein
MEKSRIRDKHPGSATQGISFQKFRGIDLGTVSVITRKKMFIPRHSEVHGRVHSEAQNGIERKYAEKIRFKNNLTKTLFRLVGLLRNIRFV